MSNQWISYKVFNFYWIASWSSEEEKRTVFTNSMAVMSSQFLLEMNLILALLFIIELHRGGIAQW